VFLVFLVVVPELCTSLPILRLPARSAPPFALVSPCPCAKFDLLLLLFPLKKEFFFLFVVVVDDSVAFEFEEASAMSKMRLAPPSSLPLFILPLL